MQVRGAIARRLTVTALLVLAALPVQAALYKWVDQHGVTRYGDRPPVGIEADQLEDRAPEAGSTAAPDDPDAEAKQKIREGLEQKEQARAEQRRENCERARAEIKRIEDVPARNVMLTDADGNIRRLTEEEHGAQIESWRKVETENC